jgi:quercetin dioxygenase-like cupin family protein
MKRVVLLLQMIALLAIVQPASLAFGEAADVSTPVERRMQAADPPVVAELFQSVLEFEPGAWTPDHSHNGPSYNTVLEGEVILRIGDVDQTFTAGEGWIDEPDVRHLAGNQSVAPARLLASFVVTRGIPPSTFYDPEDESSLPPEPSFLAAGKMNALDLPSPMDVIHRVIELQPGTTVPAQAQPGPSILSVIEGSVTVDQDGTPRDVEAGESWVEPASEARGFTAGDTTARIVITTFAAR